MNVLLLLDRIPGPDECARVSLDTDWLLALNEIHNLVVAVDRASPSLSPLRDAGVAVHVSDKRHVHLPGGRISDADQTLASWVASHHADHPFDLAISTPERPLLSPNRRALPGVAWAVLASAGPTAIARRLSVESEWLGHHGHELWLAGSNVAAADAVISPVAPEVLGLNVPMQTVATLLPVPEPDVTHHASGDLVVVVATGVSRADAAWMLELATNAIDVRDHTTVVVLHAPAVTGAEDIGPALAEGVADKLSQQIVLVPTEREGDAGAWLAAADALVLADSSELLIPAVARRAAQVPTVVLGAVPSARARTKRLLTSPPQRREDNRTQLLQWTGPERIAAELQSLRLHGDLRFVVLHDESSVAEATRWLELEGLTGFDAVLGAAGRGPWGTPDASRPAIGVVGLHRRTWAVVADRFAAGSSLPDVIRSLGDLAGARSHTVGMVTVPEDLTDGTPPTQTGQPVLLTGGPLQDLRLPPPTSASPDHTGPRASSTARRHVSDAEARAAAEALRAWARSTNWQERARLALPWKLGLSAAIQDGEFPDGVVSWARRHGIVDRARLLLPWRWGLLPRAMEGRW